MPEKRQRQSAVTAATARAQSKSCDARIKRVKAHCHGCAFTLLHTHSMGKNWSVYPQRTRTAYLWKMENLRQKWICAKACKDKQQPRRAEVLHSCICVFLSLTQISNSHANDCALHSSFFIFLSDLIFCVCFSDIMFSFAIFNEMQYPPLHETRITKHETTLN